MAALPAPRTPWHPAQFVAYSRSKLSTVRGSTTSSSDEGCSKSFPRRSQAASAKTATLMASDPTRRRDFDDSFIFLSFARRLVVEARLFDACAHLPWQRLRTGDAFSARNHQ